jgi:hypothetical protein
MPRKRSKRKSGKRTRLEILRDIAYVVVAFTVLFGNPIPRAEQEVVALIQGPPVTYGELEALRVPVPSWAAPEKGKLQQSSHAAQHM